VQLEILQIRRDVIIWFAIQEDPDIRLGGEVILVLPNKNQYKET